MSRLVIFDRDDTLIEQTLDYRKVVLRPGVRESLSALRDEGYLLAVATNQPGPAKGECSRYDVECVNAEMRYQLAGYRNEQMVDFDAFEVCFHRSEEVCLCRKPAPGMLLSIMGLLRVEPVDCWMVGDSYADMCAAQNAGVRFARVGEGRGMVDAVARILAADARVALP